MRERTQKPVALRREDGSVDWATMAVWIALGLAFWAGIVAVVLLLV